MKSSYARKCKKPFLVQTYDEFIANLHIDDFEDIVTFDSCYDAVYSNEYYRMETGQHSTVTDFNELDDKAVEYEIVLHDAYMTTIRKLIDYVLEYIGGVDIIYNSDNGTFEFWRDKRWSWKEVFGGVIEACENAIAYEQAYDAKAIFENFGFEYGDTYKQASINFLSDSLRFADGYADYDSRGVQDTFWRIWENETRYL